MMTETVLSLLLFPMTAIAQTGANGWLGVDVVTAIRDSDAVGKLCLFVLTIISISSWAIIAFKLLHIRQAKKQTRRYTRLCSDTGRLDDAFRYASSCPDSPLAQIARETYLEVQTEEWFRSAGRVDAAHRLEVAKVSIERIHDRVITREIRHLESWLIFLATTASVSPFIGLFGTVWGVLGVFQGLATSGSADLQVIAPGIATALSTTVAGLVAAIPAVVSYNYLTSSVQSLIARMEGFALDLSNIVQKRVLED